MMRLDMKDYEYHKLVLKRHGLREDHAQLRAAVTKALELLEPIQQAELCVFKARTFLRDALSFSSTPRG
jgi:hypothetical protein